MIAAHRTVLAPTTNTMDRRADHLPSISIWSAASPKAWLSCCWRSRAGELAQPCGSKAIWGASNGAATGSGAISGKGCWSASFLAASATVVPSEADRHLTAGRLR